LQQTVLTIHFTVGVSQVTGVFTSLTRLRTSAHVGCRTGWQTSQPRQSFLWQWPTTWLGPGTQKSSQTAENSNFVSFFTSGTQTHTFFT
jgi:hypothetical protein